MNKSKLHPFMNDIVGVQLAKKKKELVMHEDKIKYLQLSLDEREHQYQQCLDDIRLLKLEIETLKREKCLLSRGIDDMTDLRLEVFQLERELNQERIRARALEELIKTPQNIHRWRKLREIDMSTYELIEQVHILQKQSLEKTQKLKEMKAICDSQTDKLSKLEDQHIKKEYIKLKKEFKVKTDKIRFLIAELKMREYQLENCVQEVPKTNTKVKNQYKSKSGTSPRKYRDERGCESAPVRRTVSKYSEKSDSEKPRRFLGGGFNIAPGNRDNK